MLNLSIGSYIEMPRPFLGCAKHPLCYLGIIKTIGDDHEDAYRILLASGETSVFSADDLYVITQQEYEDKVNRIKALDMIVD